MLISLQLKLSHQKKPPFLFWHHEQWQPSLCRLPPVPLVNLLQIRVTIFCKCYHRGVWKLNWVFGRMPACFRAWGWAAFNYLTLFWTNHYPPPPPLLYFLSESGNVFAAAANLFAEMSWVMTYKSSHISQQMGLLSQIIASHVRCLDSLVWEVASILSNRISLP